MDTIYTYEDTYWKEVAKRNAKVSPEQLMIQVACDLVQLPCEGTSNIMSDDVPYRVRLALYNAYHILQEVDRKLRSGEPYEDEEFRIWKKKGGKRNDL